MTHAPFLRRSSSDAASIVVHDDGAGPKLCAGSVFQVAPGAPPLGAVVCCGGASVSAVGRRE